MQDFLHQAEAQNGEQYIYGANADFNNPHPKAFDCSDLVQWATHRVGISMPRTASEQYEFLRKGGHMIPVEQAVHTPGALLFNFSSNPDDGQPAHGHVAISLGNGKTMEALGPQYGVGSWNANTTRFNYAAVIPGLSPGPSTPAAPATAAPPTTPSAAAPATADTHQATAADAHPQTQTQPQTTASIVDAFEARLAADPHAMDTQAPVLNASQQLTAAPTGAAPADSAHTDTSADHSTDPSADHTADNSTDHSAEHAPVDHHIVDTDHHDGADHFAVDPVDHTDPALASALLWTPPPEDHHYDPYTDASHSDHFGDAHDAGIH